MSLLDCLQPRTVVVRGARRVVLGSNRKSGREGRVFKFKGLQGEALREYNRKKKARWLARKRAKAAAARPSLG